MATLVVTPPAQGRKGSSANPKTVEQMAQEIGKGVYVTDGAVYKSTNEAVNAANIYRRALALELNVEAFKITSRVWGTEPNGKAAKRTAKGAQWRFALTLDPDRKKITAAKK